MEIPRSIEVKNPDGARTAILSPKSDALKDVYIDCRLNGESTLEFSLPAESEKIDELTPECQIWAGGRVYSLLTNDAVDTERDENNKLWAKFMALERWKPELEASFIEPSLSNDPTIPNPADLAVIIVGGGSDLSGGRYAVGSAAHALYAILQGSGWTLGTCDVPGTHDIEMEKSSRLDLIKEVQNIWGGYLLWDSVNKTVSLRDPNVWQNYTGFQVRYRKNLKHITRTQSNRLITKLYCFGHDDLDIASVNDGVKYLTNFSYTPWEYVGTYRNQDIYDANELKEKAAAELKLNCKPRYLYRIKIVDLRTLPEYAHEDFALGDMIDVIDPSVAPDSPRPRLIRHKYNVFQPWDCELELGNPEERFIEKLKASFDTAGFIDNKFNGNGQSSGYSIEDLTIENGKIINLDAEKITTGYLSADRIMAGSIGADKIKTDELVVGTNVQLGTAQDANGVTTIIGNTVTTGYVNALEITAEHVVAGISITSPTIMGGELIGGTVTAGETYKIALGSLGNNYGTMEFQEPDGTPLGAFYCQSSDRIALETSSGVDIEFWSFGNILLSAYDMITFDTEVKFMDDVDFSYANVDGLDDIFAAKSHTHSQYLVADEDDYVHSDSGELRIEKTSVGIWVSDGSDGFTISKDP